MDFTLNPKCPKCLNRQFFTQKMGEDPTPADGFIYRLRPDQNYIRIDCKVCGWFGTMKAADAGGER